MTDPSEKHVFLSYSEGNRDFVEGVARRLAGDARLSLWFAPWHAVPGEPLQEQMEEALWDAQACALFLGGEKVSGWQNEEMRVALQTRVEDDPQYRVIPVFVPGSARPAVRALPRFLRRYLRQGLEVAFRSADDEAAYRLLLAGILGIAPIEVEGYLDAQRDKPSPVTTPPVPGYDLGAIRSLLRDAFTDKELRRFCQDRAPFRPVLSRFSSGAGLEDMIDVLLDYCHKQLLCGDLLTGAQEHNPRQYERHRAQLEAKEE